MTIINRYFFILVLSLSTCLSILGQDTAVYELKTNFFKLGEMKAIELNNSDSDTKIFKLESNFKLGSLYDIQYYLESVFKHEKLEHAVVYIKANEKTKHFCEVKLNGGYYIRKTMETVDTINTASIINGTTKLYFQNFNGTDSIFAEHSGQYVSFTKIGENKFLLNGANLQEYTFNSRRVSKITVPNPILDFFVVLK